MKSWRRTGSFIFACALAGGMPAQPETTLREAADRLVETGNYAWDERHLMDWSGLPTRKFLQPLVGTGETIIDGFTIATIRGHRVVLWKEEVAFETKAGWRYAKDLTEEDTVELGARRGRSPRADPPMRSFGHLLPHEVLRLVLPLATNVQGSDVLTADLAGRPSDLSALESYISRGVPVMTLDTRRILGTVSPLKATLTAEISGGSIAVITVAFSSSSAIPIKSGGLETGTSTREYRFELRKIGTTRVVIDPEAKALFLAAGKEP